MAEEKSAKKTRTKETEPKETTVSEQEDKGKKKGWLIGLACGAVAVIVGVILAIVLNLKPADQSDPTAKLSYTKSFFIYDNKYTLWNDEGKRLTEDEYSETSSFVGGYAYVKKDGQVGIIKDDGKMSVEFGKYGSITAKGGLYLVQDGNTKEYSLITGSGKELIHAAKLDVSTPAYTSGFAVVKTDNTVTTYDYTGRMIFETQTANDADAPSANNQNDFGIVYYANQNFVFDARDGRLIASFEGERYSFEETSKDRKSILLEDYADTDKYKLVTDGKVYDLNEMEYYSFIANGMLVGYNMSEIALLDDNYKVMKKVSTYVEIKDAFNYAVEKKDGGVEVYRNGEKVKDLDGEVAISGVLYDDYYAIVNDGKAMFYNLDGSVGINHEYRDIDELFDEFHHAVVSDDGEEYYLIDTTGKRITDYAATYFSVGTGGYEVRNNDKKCAVADKSGKLVSGFDYEDTDYHSYAEPRNIWSGEKSSTSSDVIDVDAGKIIASDLNVQSFYANYFTAKNSEGKTTYYTYTGTLFYTAS